MLTLVSSVFIFGLLIFCHELGHYLVAKKTGIGVREFAIGFGPRVLSWQGQDTVYSLRAFPLGGFVRLVGDDPEEEDQDHEHSFQNFPVWSRFAVIASGPVMNFVLAILLFSLIYFAFLGIPQYDSAVIGDLLPGGEAEAAGLLPGDRLIEIDGVKVGNWYDVVTQINKNPEKEIVIVYERNDSMRSLLVTPRRDPQTRVGIIGITPKTRRFAFLPSLAAGFSNTVGFIRFIFMSLVQMLSGKMAPDVVGPVGIVKIVGEVARTGVVNLLSLAAIISVNLGLFNLLPIPALDGSRLMFLVAEAIRGKPVDPRKESLIHFVGFTVLILFMLLVAYRDLVRFEIFF